MCTCSSGWPSWRGAKAGRGEACLAPTPARDRLRTGSDGTVSPAITGSIGSCASAGSCGSSPMAPRRPALPRSAAALLRTQGGAFFSTPKFLLPLARLARRPALAGAEPPVIDLHGRPSRSAARPDQLERHKQPPGIVAFGNRSRDDVARHGRGVEPVAAKPARKPDPGESSPICGMRCSGLPSTPVQACSTSTSPSCG